MYVIEGYRSIFSMHDTKSKKIHIIPVVSGFYILR